MSSAARRVLVPLDGTALSRSILPYARRLAGPKGRLVLMSDIEPLPSGHEPRQTDGIAEALETVAHELRDQGVQVEVHPVAAGDPAVAIDEAVVTFRADMLAVATHGLRPEERWQTGTIAWRALLRSAVPVLIRHVANPAEAPPERSARRILVPLDGSALAEKALPLADDLACQWGVPLLLATVVPDTSTTGVSHPAGPDLTDEQSARAYLRTKLDGRPNGSEVRVLQGAAAPAIVQAVADFEITDIVMTSHGKTGLSRFIVGSVADELIHALECPIIILPPLVTLA